MGPCELHQVKQAWCKVLHLGQDDHQYQYMLREEWIESNCVEKDLGVLVDGKLDMSWQCTFVAQKINHMQGYIKSGMASRWTEVILPLCHPLVRPHLECCVQLLAPHYRKDTVRAGPE